MVLYERSLTVGAPKASFPYATLLALNAAKFGAAASVDLSAPVAELNLDGERMRNDVSIARLVAASKGDADLVGAGLLEQATIDGLVTLAERVVDEKITAEQALKTVSFGKGGTLYDGRITIADIALWSIVAKDEKLQKAYPVLFSAILNDSRFAEAHTMVGKFDVPKAAKTSNANANNKKSKDEGKFVDLPGAEMGKVIVRFPPEASGYLHIGHAKAALLNQYYQQAFQGQLIMRFDDTNPAKENAHFEEVIKEDLKMLQIIPDRWTHSSDYFDMMLEMCERLIKEGKAFVDDTDTETMRKEREERKDSRMRNTSPADNLALWEEMKKGSTRGQQCCVRIKIDMTSNNGTMRDPTIYRCKPEEHVRTGMKYKVYPTYDFACPIVDSVEGVTHTLRTTEYHDRDDQYFFIADALGLRKPHIWEYARLNMTNTVMSKRKLTWFVEEGIVDGWDDPRFPTVRGVMRRGMTVEGLKQFIVAQGGSRSIVMMEWDKIWAFNKKVIDPVAPRYTALETTAPLVPVLIADMKSVETAKVNLHPKDAAIGEKTIHRGPKLLIEQVDAKEMKAGDVVTFVNWGNLKIAKVETGKDGLITAVHANLDLQNQDFKKTLKVTWLGEVKAPTPATKSIPLVVATYDHIISKAVIGKDEDWKQYINRDSVTYTKMVGEPAIAGIKKGDIIQLQRKGFFICDHPYAAKSEWTGAETPLTLIAIPDGSQPQNGKAAAAKPAAAAAAAPAASVGFALYTEIEAQGNLVRDAKTKDAKSQETKDAIAKLLELKKTYKEKTGQDYKPGAPPAAPAAAAVPAAAPAAGNDAASLYAQIETQGNVVREVKTKDAKSQATKDAIAKLLELKKTYKEKTGKEYKPGEAPAAPAAAAPAAAAPTGNDPAALYAELEAQGNLVRELKGKDAKSQATKDAITKLLDLKKSFKEKTGQDYKPGAPPAAAAPAAAPAAAAPAGNDPAALYAELEAQGNLVRELKGKDAKSQATKDAITKLLDLKKSFKEKTGQDYKPGAPPAAAAPAAGPAAAAPAGNDPAALYAELEAQGNLVRELKGKDAKSQATKDAITKLLDLKKSFKEKTGQDYKPGAPPAAAAAAPAPAAAPTASAAPAGNDPAALYAELEAQGNLVRELKGKDAKSQATKDAITKLLDLKKSFKEKTGQDYKPGAPPAAAAAAPAPAAAPAAAAAPGADIAAQIVAQGDLVREVKAKDAKSQETKDAIAKLLELKKAYKEATGQDYKPPAAPAAAAAPKKEEKKPQQPKVEKPKKEEKKKEEKKDEGKKQTKLGMEMRKDDNYSEWYSQVITKAEMIEYYDVSGCYVLRPWSYSIWEVIKGWFDKRIKKMGVKNCYFPMFVSQGALEREKDHIADFAPEVAWVTRAGSSEMAEPIAIRPTSETVMYPSYRKWVQSHRDLPLKLNQWCNVVRWEFKHPTPFLRTREFLWQEGHTAYANPEDAQKEVFQILDLYAGIYEELLAIPVVKGRKSEKEKFAGGDFTTTVEAYVPVNGRGVQGATSHHLGQNFSKMFDINFEGEKGKKEFAYQNSWGLTTRTIGAMVMVHGDDAGLVLPPRVAGIQVIALPVGITASTSDADRERLVAATRAAVDALLQKDVRAESDLRDNYSPGWKFNHWELKGVPIRMEIGPKDLAAGQATLVVRFDGSKQAVPLSELPQRVPQLLEEIHHRMFQKVVEQRNSHMKTVKDFGEFRKHLDEKCILLAPFCGRPDCEDAVKRDSQRDDLVDVAAGSALMGAKTLCIPIDQPSDPLGEKCIHPDCKEAPKAFALFGRSY